jgi:hypothetical protein
MMSMLLLIAGAPDISDSADNRGIRRGEVQISCRQASMPVAFLQLSEDGHGLI